MAEPSFELGAAGWEAGMPPLCKVKAPDTPPYDIENIAPDSQVRLVRDERDELM